jgi:hypothetical protein
VASPMRRIILPALLAALALAPPAHAAGASTTEIIRDCFDDSVLQGHYTVSELRKARANLPTDVDEYSDCRDVLSRAIAAQTQATGGGGGGSPGSFSGGGSGGSDGGTGTPLPQRAPDPQKDQAALQRAGNEGSQPVDVAGLALAPGSAGHAGGGNPLPGSMIVVLALLGATVVAAILPFLRRHVRPRPPA